jgi:hypothetical protein
MQKNLFFLSLAYHQPFFIGPPVDAFNRDGVFKKGRQQTKSD